MPATEFLGRLVSLPSACVLSLVLLAATGCDSSPATGTGIRSKLFNEAQIIGTWGTAPGQLNKPRSLALDAQDNLYVVDMTGRVQKFSPDGKYLAHWQMPETDLGKAKGMCRDAEGNIIVIEPHYGRVNHFAPDGKLIHQWGERGTNAGQLTLPRAAAINSLGEIFVCEYTMVDRIQQFAKDGSTARKVLGRPGTGQAEFNRAEGIGIDGQDRIYVADSCNHRVQVFAPDGRFLRAFGSPGSKPGEMSYPYDVQIDAAGYQFVCEFGNSRVQVFDADGKLVEVLGRAGREPGEFNNPWALALDSKGNLYVADSRNHRVQKFVRKMAVVRSQSMARDVAERHPDGSRGFQATESVPKGKRRVATIEFPRSSNHPHGMANTFTALHYHIIFSTKHREPWMRPDIQDRIWTYLGGIARENGLKAILIGGIPDHVHMALAAPPAHAVSKAVQLIKGGSSKWIKEAFPGLRGFAWQDGYAAFTVSKSNLDEVVDYIRKQHEHHRIRTFQEEYLAFLARHGIDYDERYLWD